MKDDVYTQPDWKPTRKLAAGVGYGGLVATVLVWLVGLFDIELPDEIAVAIATIVIGAIGWLVRDRRQDQGLAGPL